MPATLVLSCFLVDCGGGSSPQTPASLSISLSPTSASIQTLGTQQFNAVVSGATDTGVTWQVSGTKGGNSTVGTITADGLYSAPGVVPNPASFSVTAIADADPTKTASAQVTITARTQVQIVSVEGNAPNQGSCSPPLPPTGKTLGQNLLISSTGRYVLFGVSWVDAGGFGGSGTFYCIRDTCIGGPNSCNPQSLGLGGAYSGDDPPSIGQTTIGGMSADACFVGESWYFDDLMNPPNGFTTLAATGVAGCPNGQGDLLPVSYSAPSVSASGRFYEFTDGSTIFVRDSCAGAGSGCVPANVWTSQFGSVGNQEIAAEGRYVVFESANSTLVPNDTNGVQDIFLIDTCVSAPAGCVSQATRVSVSTDGQQANGASSLGTITPDGRFVTFVSSASNLVPDDTNSADDIFVRDTCTGAPAACSPSTYRVSVASDGSQSSGPSGFTTNSPSISADGRYVAFASSANNLVVSDTNDFADIFVRDTCVGASNCNPTTIRVSLAHDDSEANADSTGCTISADGNYVSYTSAATNIVPNSIGASSNAFLVKVQWP